MGFQLENIALKKNERGKSAPLEKSFLKREIHVFNNAFSNKIKEDFYSELGVLIKAGVSLREGLELIEKSQKKKQNKAIVNTLSNAIVSGSSFSEALKAHKQFTNYELYSIEIGEETGTLSRVTEQLGSFFARKNEQRRNLISALTYPIIILSTAVLVVLFMLHYVVPMFQDIFEQQGVELPTITKFIIKASELLSSYGWVLLILLIAVFFIRPLMKKKQRIKAFIDRVTLRLPFIGNFVKTVYLSQFTQAVALLTASKVPVVNSIQLVKQMIQFSPLQNALGDIEKQILQGASLSDSLSQHKLFDDKMIALVKVAEETNQTEYVFERLNMQYNTQVQQQSKMLSTLMEPFIILIVGVLVGIILIAMYLPMFKLSSVMG
ncbi:type II secretion system F family protein [Hyunsoonleella flava]|uniref:Type II secretion system F family protein n=1 Tax=Hyunsoonleella flava TaxID=2527939 RepID=A0A4V2JAB0_9FLAO|nr:type II secretion system F family protein [Hyunsoonleella flava]TBN04455.1 type II secretion system F family protein [Hyunsoonleella flava]